MAQIPLFQDNPTKFTNRRRTHTRHYYLYCRVLRRRIRYPTRKHIRWRSQESSSTSYNTSSTIRRTKRARDCLTSTNDSLYDAKTLVSQGRSHEAHGDDIDRLCSRIDPCRQFRLFTHLNSGPVLFPHGLREVDKWVEYTRTFIAAINLSKQGHSTQVVFEPQVSNSGDEHMDVAGSIRKRSVYYPTCLHEMPIVLDSGASTALSPIRSDFINELTPPPIRELTGISGKATMEGIGTVEWTIYDLFGTTRTIRTKACYVPSAGIRLFSPQAYFQEHGEGKYMMTQDRSILTLADGTDLEFPYNQASNLPLMLPTSSMATAGLTFSDRQYLSNPPLLSSFLSVADETNQNITASQKELLLWHWKLGHAGFQWIQHLASIPREPLDGIEYPILKCKQPRVSSCPAPLCTACQLANQHRRGAGTSLETHRKDKANMLRRDERLYPGRKVSIDQYLYGRWSSRPHERQGAYERQVQRWNDLCGSCLCLYSCV